MAQTVKNPPAVRETGSILGSGRFPWRRAWQPTPVFLPGESHGQRSLAGYSPRRRKESDTTEQWSTSTGSVQSFCPSDSWWEFCSQNNTLMKTHWRCVITIESKGDNFFSIRNVWIFTWGFLDGSDSKESASNAGDLGLIPGSGISLGGGNGYPLWYSWPENSMDRGAW